MSNNAERHQKIAAAAIRNEYFPAGHFYSPIPDYDELEKRKEFFCDYDRRTVPGIDLCVESQLDTLKVIGELKSGFDWPADKVDDRRYYSKNNYYGRSSGIVLFAMIAHFQPDNILEVGSGFSSALMLDMRHHGTTQCNSQMTFIEPHPDRLKSLMREEDLKDCRVLDKQAQDVPLAEFEALESGDLLFIDSTHVAKTGSDVLFLYHEVLPRLNSGVIIHIHDIYWPFEYPRDWIFNRKWAWNEAYLLRAFLQFNNEFEIICFNHYLACVHPESIARLVPELRNPGGSIWLRKR